MPESLSTPSRARAASLRFNGQALAVTDPLTLSDLLALHNIEPDAVATAVNGQFVPRDLRAETALRHGDDVITFQAIVGG